MTTIHINPGNQNLTQSIPVPGSTTGECVTITPLGSGMEVGRSCILVKFSGHSVMLDCGIHPAKNGIESLPLFDDMGHVDLCLVTHFHLDHCGGLPYLCEQTTFNGRVFMTHPTHAFFNMVMSDLLKINAKGTEDVVTDEWLQSTLNRVERISYHQEIRHQGIRFQALNAGHVLGAAMFLLEIAGVRILYTGDYSRIPDRHLLAAELPPVSPDILIVESTYGILKHKSTAEREHIFVSEAVSIVQSGGRCLVPVFALGRAQELLLILEEHWEANPELHGIPIYFASSIANPCINQYKTFAATAMNQRVQKQLENDVNPFDFRYIKYLPDITRFEDRGPCVVLASPGMLQSGLSRALFERWCSKPQNGVIIAGYCIDGTIAANLKRGDRQIEVEDGRVLHVNMRPAIEVSFSAHADVEQTTNFIAALPATKHVVLVHGSPMAVKNLEKRLQDTFTRSRNLSVYTPNVGETVSIKFERQRTATLLGNLASKASALLLQNSNNNNNNNIKKQQQQVLSTVQIEGVAIQAEDHQLAFVAPNEVSNFSDITLCQDFQQAVVIPMATFRTAKEISSILNSYYLNSAWIDRSAFIINANTNEQEEKKKRRERKTNDREGESDQSEDDLLASQQNQNNNTLQQKQQEKQEENSLFSVIPLRQHMTNNNNNDFFVDETSNNNNNDNKSFSVSEILVSKDIRVIIHEDASSGTTTVTVRWKSHRKSDIMSDVIIAALLLSDSNSIQNNNIQQQQQQQNNTKSITQSSTTGTNRIALLRQQQQQKSANNMNTNNNDDLVPSGNETSSNNNNNNMIVVGKENERIQPSDTENMMFRYQCFHRMLRQHFPSVKVNLKDGSALIVVPNNINSNNKSNTNHNNNVNINPQKWHVAIDNWVNPRVLEEELNLSVDGDDDNNHKFIKMPASLKRRIGHTLQRIFLAVNPIPFDENCVSTAPDALVSVGNAQLLEGGGWCRCGDC